MTETIRGLATQVDIASAYAPDVPVALLTRAARAVATTASPHGLAAGTVGHFVATRGDIDGQAAVLGAPITPNSWTCESLNTERYRQFPLGLVFRPVQTWTPLLESVRFSFVEPERASYDATTIDMHRQRLRAGSPRAYTASFGVAPQTRLSEGMALLQEIAERSAAATFRVRLHDGAVLVFRGEPTNTPGVDVTFGSLASSSFAVLVHGVVLRQRQVPASTYVEIDIGGTVVEIELTP